MKLGHCKDCKFNTGKEIHTKCRDCTVLINSNFEPLELEEVEESKDAHEKLCEAFWNNIPI